MFDFVRDNPLVNFHPCNWTNDVGIIGRNPKVVAINSALQIDLSGQVCADSIGHRIFSGIGGQMDFIRGAARSPGGKPIIALPSRAMGGKVSRIVSELNPGAGVVTEFGVVNLHGKTLRERSEALISIAHPDFRAELARDIQRIRHFPPPPPLDLTARRSPLSANATSPHPAGHIINPRQIFMPRLAKRSRDTFNSETRIGYNFSISSHRGNSHDQSTGTPRPSKPMPHGYR